MKLHNIIQILYYLYFSYKKKEKKRREGEIYSAAVNISQITGCFTINVTQTLKIYLKKTFLFKYLATWTQ